MLPAEERENSSQETSEETPAAGKIRISGTVAINRKGERIPKEILGANRIDRIWIESVEGGKREFLVVVSEEPGGTGRGRMDIATGEAGNLSGGGLFGEALDAYAFEIGKKEWPCVGYSEIRGGDIYRIDIDGLTRVWDIYRGGRVIRKQISEAQKEARRNNMQKAIERRDINRENRRRRRVEGKIR